MSATIPQSTWLTLQQSEDAALHLPASETLIQKIHEAIGQELPEALLEAYRHHNGQAPQGTPLFMDEYRWLSMQEALQEWRTWQGVMARPDMGGMHDTHESCGGSHAKVRMDWWNGNWWPLAISDLSDLLCVDGQPGPRGVMHQVILVSSAHEGRSLAATSLADLFNNAAADMAGDLA